MDGWLFRMRCVLRRGMGCTQPNSCTRLLLGALALRCSYSLAAFGSGLAAELC